MRCSGFLPSRDVAQPGRALAWGARGRQFKSARPDQYSIAGNQMVSHVWHKEECVPGLRARIAVNMYHVPLFPTGLDGNCDLNGADADGDVSCPDAPPPQPGPGCWTAWCPNTQ